MLVRKVQQIIRERRRSAPFRQIAAASEKYLRAWYAEDFPVFDKNGERFAIAKFNEWFSGTAAVIWDIGAHEGEWAYEAHSIMPNANVTSFEILKPIADRIPPAPWLKIENLGMSSSVGEVDLLWNKSYDTTNAIEPRLDNKWFVGSDLQTVKCQVTTIDEYARGKATPDLLKIDTEGHEAAVFAGAQGLLASSSAPAMIQFEYGDTWLTSESTLGKVQAMLAEHGYSVGRLYPNHVAFKDYAYADDNFRMGNMIAVKDSKLRELLGK